VKLRVVAKASMVVALSAVAVACLDEDAETVDEPLAQAVEHELDAEEEEQQELGEIRWIDESGVEFGARALSVEEVRERGLDKYVDLSRYKATAPRLVRDGKGAALQTESRAAGDGTTQATGCWSAWFGSGVFEGVFTLYGRTDVNWCGDGTWVTHKSSGCSGVDGGYPTYEYLGCDNREEYGVGWNVYEVWSQWHLCIAWVPTWPQACASNQDPWQEYQFWGDGAFNLLASG
jgi:hypothetical protein